MGVSPRFLTLGLAGSAVLLSLSAWADENIRILCPTWPGFAPVLVANDLGYFTEEGITVDMKFEDDRSNVMAAFARGDIEVDMRTVDDIRTGVDKKDNDGEGSLQLR